MMDAQAKQQVIERIKSAENILVTVSTDPSVDQLAACIGSALMFNKMQKRGTAIYSGKTPSTIEFLQPEKTLETNTDSLRDFIISLDKNKADKLRYKVEDRVVRIYITPYRTSLSQKDLEFTMGDYNVDLVIALGVKDKAHIDGAIAAHGRILHDAPVIAVNAGQTKAPDVGQINWQDPQASSLSEMMVSISEALGTGLIDNQIATAFLTGIVAETERFSNSKTTSKVMTMSAQLMAAGANQQLIATKLAPPPPEPPPAPKPPVPAPKKPAPPAAPKNSGEITIDHSDKKKLKNDDEVKIGPNEIRIDEKGNIEKAQELLRLQQAAQQPKPATSAAAPSDLPSMLSRTEGPASPDQSVAEPAPPARTPTPTPTPAPTVSAPITNGSDSNSPIKTFRHDGSKDMFDLPKPGQGPAFSATSESAAENEWYDPLNPAQNPVPADAAEPNQGFIGKAPDVPAPAGTTATASTNPMAGAHVDNARNSVETAYSTAPYDATRPQPIAGLNAQPMADLHTPPQLVQKAPDMAAPAPPPVPPPLPLGNTPPIPVAPSPAKQNHLDGTGDNSRSPNSAWPL